jgi:hypothetical protein
MCMCMCMCMCMWHATQSKDSSTQVQVELKKGETILTDASLHLPAACLHEAFSHRSGVPPDHFELYYRGKRLEGEAALASWGVEKDATIEVKMRGRGGMSPGGSDGAGRSDGGGGVGGDGGDGGVGGGSETTAVEVKLHSGFDLKSAQASSGRRSTHPIHTNCSKSLSLNPDPIQTLYLTSNLESDPK